MSNEIAAALIGVGGAVSGGIVASIITYVATVQSVTEAARLAAKNAISDKVIDLMDDFLTEHTAEQVKEGQLRVAELDHQLERLFKNVDMHGHHEISRIIATEGNGYLEALRKYADDEMSADQLNEYRVQTRNKITATFAAGGL